MLKREGELVTPEFVKRKDNYNICVGGGKPLFGKVVVVDTRNGCILKVDKDDPRYLSGELKHISTGKATVIDESGNAYQVDKNDPRILSGELRHISTGKVTVVDGSGKYVSS